MKHSNIAFISFVIALLCPIFLLAGPDLVFGSGSTRVEVYYACNSQNSCIQCSAVYFKAASPGTWTFQCGGMSPINYSNTPYVCFTNCTSFNVTFTYNGQSSSAYINAPNAYPNVTANFVTSNGCQMLKEEQDEDKDVELEAEDREALVCVLCVVDASTTSSPSCPIDSWRWTVTYNCPMMPTYYYNGPGPHNIPIHPVYINVCLKVTAGCTEKTVCKQYSCIRNCPGFADPNPSDIEILPSEIIQLLEEEKPDIQISPNPTSGNIHIANLPDDPEDKSVVEIFDVLGRRVNSYSLEQAVSEADITLNDVPQGIYILVVKDKTGKLLHSQKLAIE